MSEYISRVLPIYIHSHRWCGVCLVNAHIHCLVVHGPPEPGSEPGQGEGTVSRWLHRSGVEIYCMCRVILVGLVQCVTLGQFFFWIFSLSLYVWFKA